jgi:hypothetical protein
MTWLRASEVRAGEVRVVQIRLVEERAGERARNLRPGFVPGHSIVNLANHGELGGP